MFSHYLQQLKKKISNFSDKEKEQFEITPHRDWTILLFAAALLLVVVAGVGYYLFVQVDSGEAFVPDSSENAIILPTMFKVEELQSAINGQDMKKTQREQYLLNRPTIIDTD